MRSVGAALPSGNCAVLSTLLPSLSAVDVCVRHKRTHTLSRCDVKLPDVKGKSLMI